ncbi:hypothetical protein Tco_0857631 [Tanacetum coccineum]|uniref:Uncharacterized protein n=1 Tax=Tanacetum coccineum TaxID=301880 RepID=A0ABQ5BB11_9ASTR
MQEVGVRSGSESFSQTENGIRLMLAPRSANAKHSSIPGNSQGIRNLPGSPSFLGNLFKMTAEQCSFIEVRARQGSLEVRATSLIMAIFHYQSIEGYGSRTEGLVFAWEHQRAATLGSMNWCCDWFQDYTASTKLSQHISQIAIGLFQLAVSICAATGTLVLEVGKLKLIGLLLAAEASDTYQKCCPDNRCHGVAGQFWVENGHTATHIRAAPSDRGEWKKHSLMSNWNIGDPHCGGDLVEVTDMSMRVFFVMTEELFTDFTVALEAQAATMANADNPNRNTRPSANSYLRICRLLPKHVPNAEKLVDGLLQGLPGSIEEMFTASKPHKLRG